MKYTAPGEGQVANVAQGKAECYICHETLTNGCILSYKWSGSILSVSLYFTLKDELIEDTPLKLYWIQILISLIKNVSLVHHSIITLAFYNYPTTVL